MSAELLRRAAAKLRTYAPHATRGPWTPADDGLVWSELIGDPVSGSVELEDAEYIALMHPPVALALAEWLDAHRDSPCSHALGVARAILREPS